MPRFVRRQRERQAHPNGVAGFDRNRWPTSVGTGGRIASESVAGLARITHSSRWKAGKCTTLPRSPGSGERRSGDRPRGGLSGVTSAAGTLC